MRLKRHQLVASFTDAWIETVEGDIVLDTFMSHLLQMRGLKHIAHKYNYHCHMSHLLQMRGLKPACSRAGDKGNMSHLLQMRGLKPLFKGAFERVFNVASFTGTTFIIFFARRLQD